MKSERAILYSAGFFCLLAPMSHFHASATAAEPTTQPLKKAVSVYKGYVWNRVLPPLLRRDPDIVTIAQKAHVMCKKIAPVINWTSTEEHRTSEQVLAWQQSTNDYAVSHEHCWKLLVKPQRLAYQMQKAVVFTDSSEEVRRKTVVDTLLAELKLNSDSKFIGVNATIKQDIQRTTEAINTWSSVTQETITVVYPPKMWTAVWVLVDTIHMIRKTTITNSCCQPRRYDPASTTEVSTMVEGLLSTYQDEASDEQMLLANPGPFDGFRP